MERRGFTLIELLVVVAIIGSMASIIVASVNTARQKAKYAAAKQLDSNFYHNLGDSLIAQYLFDDGTANDSSGDALNGTLVGSPTFSSNTPFGAGQSLSLDGVSQRVILPIVLSGSICSMTISAWSYDADMPMTGDRGGVVGASGGGWYADMEYRDGDMRFELNAGNAGYVTGNYKNTWIFTVLTFQGGIPRGYINGNLVWTGSPVGCQTLSTWQIGSWDRYFNGQIDNVRIYDRALDTAEIRKLYAEEAPLHAIAFVNDPNTLPYGTGISTGFIHKVR